MYRIEKLSKSVTGRRAENQDSCIAEEIGDNLYFFAVADGMGGARGGEIASEIVIKRASEIVHEEYKAGKISFPALKPIVDRIYDEAQEVVSRRVQEEPELTGMGTTLTCLLIYKDRFVLGNLGDSRIYRIRGGKINQITRDHTYIQELIDEKGEENVSPEMVRSYGHIITRSISGNDDFADIFPADSDEDAFELKDGDFFILCSDGLINDKSERNQKAFLHIVQEESLESAADVLIKYALDNGSTDNISVILVEVGKFSRIPQTRKEKEIPEVVKPVFNKSYHHKSPGNHLKYLSYLILGLIIILATGTVYILYQQGIFKDIFINEQKSTDSNETPDPQLILGFPLVAAEKLNYEGFENSEMTLYISQDNKSPIVWKQMKDDRLVEYQVTVRDSSNKIIISETFKEKNSSCVTLEELAISKIGRYVLNINAILPMNQIVEGEQSLKLIVK